MQPASNVGSTPFYDVIAQHNVMVPLRDGVRLATDIYFPARNGQVAPGQFPAVLERTPYDKSNSPGTGKYYAARGYVAAVQDVRGRYESEGEFYAFAHEGPDGFDSIEWLAGQRWCNGKVGTFGASYCAADQSAAACLCPPHLSSMIVTFGPSSYYHSSLRHNGALELRFVAYAFTMAATSKEARADPNIRAALDEACANIWHWLKALPIRAGATPLRLTPSYEQWCLDILTRAEYDDYWRLPGWGPKPHHDRYPDVPTLYIGGWYDTYTRGTVENFVELSRRTEAPVHLLMGPWTHGGVGTTQSGDVSTLPDGGLADHESARVQWLDYTLKGMPTVFSQARPVRYFMMGGGAGLTDKDRNIYHGGEWRHADHWPPAGVRPTAYYFHADGSLRPQAPAHETEPTRYVFNPEDPVPTIGGHNSAFAVPAGGFDQRNDARFPTSQGSMPLSARQDVICFVTEPLPQDVVIAGPIRVKLWVSTDGADTDFTAKLMDVYPPGPYYPNGCALNLTDSIQRLRFRESYDQEKLAVPGETYELSFELYPNANRFKKGHQIRVDVSSSNFPRFDVNPNTGGPVGRERRTRKAENCLYHDMSRPSHIVLPVLEE